MGSILGAIIYGVTALLTAVLPCAPIWGMGGPFLLPLQWPTSMGLASIGGVVANVCGSIATLILGFFGI
jgi:hypothetical protein